MVGDYGRPERMGWGRCFSLRSHSSPLIESHQVFFSHRRKPYSVTMVVDLTCDHWLVLPRRICKGEWRCRAKVAALMAVIRILVLLGGAGRDHAVCPSWVDAVEKSPEMPCCDFFERNEAKPCSPLSCSFHFIMLALRPYFSISPRTL